MGIKKILAKPFSSYEVKKFLKANLNPLEAQMRVFENLISTAKDTNFGKDHHFEQIKNHTDFTNTVPVRDYEDLKAYIQLIIDGNQDVLWPGAPKYFAKTSGTTSGIKYIPITDVSIKQQVKAARMALQFYIHQTKNTNWVEGKMIFLQGSPELDKKGAINAGRLSGIVYHEVPKYLLSNRLPSLQTNIIEDWESKLVKIVSETVQQDMTLISGIAPWMIMYFEKLLAQTGKQTLKEIWPNLTLYVHGGVNFKPYEKTFSKLIGNGVDYIETYPASEGFIAFQDNYKEEGLLLNTDGGIFYEFIQADQIFEEKPKRIWLNEVELGINYAIILNTNAGLWGYNIGDTIKFVSLNPFKIVVTGRIKHFISAFGEHVIVEEVESAITALCAKSGVEVIDFTVAPQIEVENGLPYHEWFIEFKEMPNDINHWRLQLDEIMQQKNIYYKDLINGNILQPLKISPIKTNGFRDYMESIGKLCGQNKIPRLGNDRKMAEKLSTFLL
jgi:hypothetical protein